MGDDSLPFYSPFRKPAAPVRTKLEGERLWTLHRDSHVVIGGILIHKDPIGFEFMEFVDAHFIQSRRFGQKELAFEFAESVRARYERDGWSDDQKGGQ